VKKLNMTPAEALTLSTKNAAEALGKSGTLGTIEKGKLADILVVRGNALQNIEVLQDQGNIKVVMKGGKIEVDRR